MARVQPDPHDPTLLRVVEAPVPQRTSDWMRALVDVLTYVAVRRTLTTSMLYVAEPGDTTAGLAVTLVPVAPLLTGLSPATVADLSAAPGWAVLHPAGTMPTPDLDEAGSEPVAVGSLLLPGVPAIGLDHRAAWAAVDISGRVAHMRYTGHVNGSETLDLAVLAALLDG